MAGEAKNGIKRYVIPALISVLLTCFLVAIGYNYAGDSKQQTEIVKVDDCVRKVENQVTGQGKDIENIREQVKEIKGKVEKIQDNTELILRRLPR